MKIRILCVGRVKEAFYRNQLEDYAKAIRKRAEFEIIEVEDEKTGEHMSDVEIRKVIQTEGDRMKKYLVRTPGRLIVALCIDGKRYSTEQWGKRLQQIIKEQEITEVTYVIGGSLGLAEEIGSLANQRLSFSALTYPHQLMRVILVQQIADHMENYL